MKKYHNSVEIKDRKAQLKKKANEIIERCKSEVRDLQEDEKSELETIKKEITDLNTQLSDLEERLKISALMKMRKMKRLKTPRKRR